MPIRYSSVVGGAASSGFNLDIGSSGNTTFVFSEAQPAGGYSITSQLTDATIEFYAIAEDGSLAGYTNTKALTATQDFTKMVVYGASNNDLITFEFKPTTLPTGDGDQDSGAAPYITSISDADLANIDDTTIITGGNFATDVVVTFTGTDTIIRNAKSVVRTSSTQLIVTRPDEMLEDNAPYTITVSNPGIPQSVHKTFTASVTAGTDPIWVTSAGSIGNFLSDKSMSVQLSANDSESGLSYTLSSGLLPNGLSINTQTGELSGAPTTSGTFNFEVSAEDSGGNISTREFSITISQRVLATGGLVEDVDGYRYHTFTSSGTLEITDGGEGSFVEYLLVAGGGGGATDYEVGGGGGGGGLVSGILNNVNVSDTYPILIGAGGSRGSGIDETNTGGGSNGTNGENTTAFGLTAIGGGAGATRGNNGLSGGSGGGAGDGGPRSGGAALQPSSASGGFGNSGGSSANTNNPTTFSDTGAGGGAGGPATGSPTQNIPGPGLYNNVGRGTFAAGGNVFGLGGYVLGAPSTGNGGSVARNGGSGVVAVRYQI